MINVAQAAIIQNSGSLDRGTTGGEERRATEAKPGALTPGYVLPAELRSPE